MVQLNDDTLEVKVKESNILLVDFYADWCGPCRAMMPILAEIAEFFEDEVQVGKINIDTAPEATMKYHVTTMPTILIFKDGELVQRLIGAQSKSKIETTLKNIIA